MNPNNYHNNNNHNNNNPNSNSVSLAGTSTLFLGDLSIYCTEKDIQEVFSSFGAIDCIQLKKGGDCLHLCYGFVKFLYRESADLALSTMNGKIFLGRPLR